MISVRAPQAFQIHDALLNENGLGLVERLIPMLTGPYGIDLRAPADDGDRRSVTTRGRACCAAHPVIDGHNDFPYAMRTLVDYDLDAVDITGSVAGTQTDLPRLRAGGVGGQFWSVFVPSSWAGENAR